MSQFTDRFKRVRESGTKKHYIDLQTGETVTYRRALTLSKTENITRSSYSRERVEASSIRAREYHADVKEFAVRWNKRHRVNKITNAQAAVNGEFLLEQKIKKKQRVAAFAEQLPENISTLRQAVASYERAVRFVGHDVTGRSVSRQGIRQRSRVRLFRAVELRA